MKITLHGSRRRMDELDRLLAGISTYQDVVVGGETVRRGVRDCEQRRQAIAPHLPQTGVLLDVGANFAWFCLKWCEENPKRLAVAWEADYRTAAVARHVLESHEHRRIVLCTALADAAAVERCERAGQRFDAVLCLSILHWIPDHRRFLTTLGRIADRILIEQPNQNEAGAGVEAIRESIGDIGSYLRELFPDRPVEKVATWTAHLNDELPRELWLVGKKDNARGDAAPIAPALDVGGLLTMDVAWPPRSWWINQMSRLPNDGEQSISLSSGGLETSASSRGADGRTARQSKRAWIAACRQIPESGVVTMLGRFRRRLRSIRRRLRI